MSATLGRRPARHVWPGRAALARHAGKSAGNFSDLEINMKSHTQTIQELYTRKVGGEIFRYELRYTHGHSVKWSAHVYQDEILKGTPQGVIEDHDMDEAALRQYLVSYVEGVIERGMGIAE
ncbi:hypothetical protein CEY11_00825 [Candidimonas nitroreducens]|uniref:Uncharacterized protein n=2 Tax=Candidimonas nitroreducens TaxID=683354 RepID=A0A225MYG9_9BURK|nr:hypothetical protein CEY11_00825 [Candidimonas nitroreducens]